MMTLYVVGRADTGKTRLVASLIPELKRRGYTVGVVKHCGHGFDSGPAGKDSRRYEEAGAEAVSTVSPDRFAVMRRTTATADITGLVEDYLKDLDMVFVEGGWGFSDRRRIEVLRRNVSEAIGGSPDNLVAVIADFKVETEKPVFHPDQVEAIADLVEGEVRS
jgi:molybdopterin-guanine dinucleotide biosynthesis protein B